jgi:hypothetical protein
MWNIAESGVKHQNSFIHSFIHVFNSINKID